MTDDDGTNTLLIVVAVLVGIPVMLGVLVIAAAVIGSFVLGFGTSVDSTAEAPSVQWESSVHDDRGRVVFTHQGDDEVLEGDVLVTVNGETAQDWETSDGRLTRGDTVTVRGVEPGDEVRLLWVVGDSRQTLAEHTV